MAAGQRQAKWKRNKCGGEEKQRSRATETWWLPSNGGTEVVLAGAERTAEDTVSSS